MNLQVEIQNCSPTNPVLINGAAVSGKALLEIGDVIGVLDHRFMWQKSQDTSTRLETELEASFQIGEHTKKTAAASVF